MLEIMIPTFNYEGNDYVIKKIKNIKSLYSVIKFCDGIVNNIFVDVEVCEDYKSIVDEAFKKYKWLNKLIIKKKESLIGIFERLWPIHSDVFFYYF